MACSRCGSDRLYQFEASKGVQVRAAALPLVCRRCGQITVDGKPLSLPSEMEAQAVQMAEAAELAGKEARKELEDEDPKAMRIEKYFANVYERGYLDGFFRCLAFYQHHAKEGRIRRMRELWSEAVEVADRRPGKHDLRGVLLPVEAYTEFEKLLTLSVAPEKPNAQDPQN